MAKKKARATARLVFVMAADEAQAEAIARALVGERLAACVNMIANVRSIYRWRGAIEDARECLLLIKTHARLYGKLERRVKELHSYEVPEVIAMRIEAGARDYLSWIEAETGPVRKTTRARKA